MGNPTLSGVDQLSLFQLCAKINIIIWWNTVCDRVEVNLHSNNNGIHETF